MKPAPGDAPRWAELRPEHYTSASVWAQEQGRIFGSAWQPVGLASALAKHQDYLCVDVAGRSVVVQNFHGELRAFDNVCSHRQSPLRCDGAGNAPLRCPYHGWTFDQAGLPSGVPGRRRFPGWSDELAASLALDRWAVEVMGPLVFVCAHPDASLAASLGPLAGEVSARLGATRRPLDAYSFELSCNWKLMVENGLEAYHVPLVHPQTLQRHELEERSQVEVGPHSQSRFRAGSGARVGRALRYAYPGAAVGEEYTHTLLFPNVYVVDVYGLYLAVSRIDPTGAGSTRFTSWVFVTWDGDGGNVELREQLNASNAEFFRRGYSEDKTICEGVHRGMSQTGRVALLSLDEERIAMFQRSWKRCMESDAQRAPP